MNVDAVKDKAKILLTAVTAIMRQAHGQVAALHNVPGKEANKTPRATFRAGKLHRPATWQALLGQDALFTDYLIAVELARRRYCWLPRSAPIAIAARRSEELR